MGANSHSVCDKCRGYGRVRTWYNDWLETTYCDECFGHGVVPNALVGSDRGKMGEAGNRAEGDKAGTEDSKMVVCKLCGK